MEDTAGRTRITGSVEHMDAGRKTTDPIPHRRVPTRRWTPCTASVEAFSPPRAPGRGCCADSQGSACAYKFESWSGSFYPLEFHGIQGVVLFLPR